MEFCKRLPSRMVLGGGFKGRYLFFQGGGPRFDVERLERGNTEHRDQDCGGGRPLLPSQEQAGDEGQSAAGKSPSCKYACAA